MCLEVVDKVVNDPKLLRLFRIPSDLWPAVRKSWKNKQRDFLGRFDWAFNGIDGQPPKLLEYNADTPSLLLESGLASQSWFKDQFKGKQNGPRTSQSNYIE